MALLIMSINIWILRILNNKRRRASSTSSMPNTVRFKQAEIMLMGSSLLFLLTQVPVVCKDFVMNWAASAALHGGAITESSVNMMADAEPIMLLLLTANYSIDFLFYAGFSKEFRRLMKDVILCSDSSKVAKTPMHNAK